MEHSHSQLKLLLTVHQLLLLVIISYYYTALTLNETNDNQQPKHYDYFTHPSPYSKSSSHLFMNNEVKIN